MSVRARPPAAAREATAGAAPGPDDPRRERDVRRAVLAVLVLAGLLLAYFLLVPRDYYTGTNSVRTRGMLIELSQATGKRLCFGGLNIPAGTGRIEFELEAHKQRAPIPLTLDVGGRRTTSTLPGGPPGRDKVAAAVPRTPAEPDSRRGSVCLDRQGPGPVFFGGVPGVAPGEEPPTLDGADLPNRAAIWFRPPAGERAAVLFQVPEIMRRAAIFKPSWTGAWTFWLIAFLVVPALMAGAIRLLLRPDAKRRLPLAVLVGLLGFANAAAWAHTTPAWNAPDETEHFAYTQSLAERGKPLERFQTARPAYSSEQAWAIRQTRIFDSSETEDGKPPWLSREEDLFERFSTAQAARRDDGGGFAPAGSSHAPLYYALTVPAYAAASGGGVFDQLFAARLVSALLGGIVAACAVLIVLELLPGRRRVAAAAGIAVAFQPMFSFMSGAVNSDMGVNAAAAVITYLLVRLLRRGWSLPVALALGVLLGLAPLFKATGFAMFPAAAVAVLLAVWRYRPAWRRWVPGVVAVVGGFAVIWVLWTQVSATLDRGTFTTPNGQAPGQGWPALSEPFGALAYTWEIFFPQLPGMREYWTQSWPAFDIFGIRGWGAFGWYALSWRHRVYWAIMIALVALTAVGLYVLWTRRHRLRGSWPELGVLATIILGVIGVMNGPYYSKVPQGALYPQQGRYVFPAITAIAVLYACAAAGVHRRWGQPLVAGLATAVVCFGYACLWLVLGGFYLLA